MKKIVEEWKPIEGFPNHEISNFGNCRRIKSGRFLKKQIRYIKSIKREYVYYSLVYNKHKIFISTGMFVAKHFIPNPNGYKFIRFKDGNPKNTMFTNIEWVYNPRNEKSRCGYDKKHFNPEHQIQILEKHIALMNKFLQSLKDGNVVEFLYSDVAGEFKEIIRLRCAKYPQDYKDELLEFCLDYFTDNILRGFPITSFRGFFVVKKREFDKKIREQGTIEFKDYMSHDDTER
jgi:hypothetical protein